MSDAAPSGPRVSLDLVWEGDLRFRGRSDGVEVGLDGDGRQGPSPVQALAFALAGCMAIDVVHILRKGRLDAARSSARSSRRSVRPGTPSGSCGCASTFA